MHSGREVVLLESIKRKIPFKRYGKFSVYIVQCRDGTYYTGYTNNLGKRIARHNKGHASRYTRSRLPVRLVWKKRSKNKSYAMKTEIIIKQLKRQDKDRIVAGARPDNILRKYERQKGKK